MLTTLSLVYISAPSLPFVKITIFTLPLNSTSLASSILLNPVINSNSSSDILTICAKGKNSSIAFLHSSSLFHNGNLTFGSKLIILLLSIAQSIAFLCASFIGQSIKSTEQKCKL